MSSFHLIISDNFTNAETSDLRRIIRQWHRNVWRDSETNQLFLDLWMSGQFDRVEIRCENALLDSQRKSCTMFQSD